LKSIPSLLNHFTSSRVDGKVDVMCLALSGYVPGMEKEGIQFGLKIWPFLAFG